MQGSIFREKFLLVVWNVLYVPLMNHNLIPLFAMIEAGIIVNDKAKVFCEKPTKDDHATIDRETGMYIILFIENTFSVFPSGKPTEDNIYDPNIPIVTVTPIGRWDLGPSLYQQNERALMDADGDIVDYERKEEHIADDR